MAALAGGGAGAGDGLGDGAGAGAGVGAAAVPVAIPSSVTARDTTPLLNLMIHTVERAPGVDGRNCAPKEQLIPGPRVVPHKVVPLGGNEGRNSVVAPSTGVMAGLAKEIVAPDELVIRIPEAALVVPIAVLLNMTGFGVAGGVGGGGGGANGGGGGAEAAAKR